MHTEKCLIKIFIKSKYKHAFVEIERWKILEEGITFVEREIQKEYKMGDAYMQSRNRKWLRIRIGLWLNKSIFSQED